MMRPLLALFVAFPVATPLVARAQESDRPPRPQISIMRAEEDWRVLTDEERRTELLDALKAIPVGDDVVLGFGGELRLRYESYEPLEFGIRGAPDNDYLLGRAYAHADLRVGDGLRAFVQLRHTEAWETSVPLGPLQDNDTEVNQAFIELGTSVGNGRISARLGRQELLLGSGRMVGPRDGPNVRLSFDGARLSYARGSGRLDAFYLRTVNPVPGSFDDESNESYALWGAYYASAPPPAAGLNFDLYYLGLKRPPNRFVAGLAAATRHTVGARVFGRGGGWDWDLEAAYQWGDFGRNDISAYTLANDVGYTFARVPLRPRIGLKLDMASGDGDVADGTLATFEVPFPKLPYLTEAALTAPANIVAIHPTVSISPAQGLSISGEYVALWKHRVANGYYLPPLRPVPGSESGPRFLGHFAQLSARWEPRPWLVLDGAIVRAWTDGALEAAGGRDTTFAYVATTFRF